jgi:hypothetical protein
MVFGAFDFEVNKASDFKLWPDSCVSGHMRDQ